MTVVGEKRTKTGGDKYVLYNVSHYGHLVNVVCHSLIEHAGESTVLMLDVGWLSKETLDFISSHDVIPGFSKVIIYNESDIDKTNVARIPDHIRDYFDSKLDSVGLKLSDACAVYSAFDTIHAFGIYLSLNGIHHTLFDFNLITSTDNSTNLFKRSEYHGLLKEYRALTWNSPLVDGVIYTLAEDQDSIRRILVECNHPCMNRSFASGKSIGFFTLKTAFSKLSDEQRKSIISFYDLQNIPSKVPAVFLTSAFYLKKEYTERYCGEMTWTEMFLYPYRILLDQVLGPCRNFILKAHPNTRVPAAYLKNIFPNATYIPGYVPSDLLGLLDLKCNLGVSPGSNSLGTLPVSKKITLPRSYFNIFTTFAKLPFLIALCKYAKCGLSLNGVSESDLESMYNIYGEEFGLGAGDGGKLTYYDSESGCPDDDRPSVVRLGHVPLEKDLGVGKQILVCYNGRTSGYSVPEERLEYYRVLGIGKSLNGFSFSREGVYSGIQRNIFYVPPYDFRSDGLFSHVQTAIENVDNPVSIAAEIDKYLKNPEKSKLTKDDALRKMLFLVDDGRYPDYLKNALSIMWKEKNVNNYPIMLEYINKYPNQPYSKRYLSMMYRYGKGVEMDLDKALDILKPLLGTRYDWSRTDSFDVIWDMGGRRDGLYPELLGMFDDSKESNLIRISKTYRFGRGNVKDLGLARDYALKATLLDDKWLKDYLGILLDIADDESLAEFFSFAERYSKNKHKDAIAAMGLAYRYGLGTEIDVVKAEEYESRAKKMGSKFSYVPVENKERAIDRVVEKSLIIGKDDNNE